MARFGLFVQMIDNVVEALSRVELLGDDYFEFLEKRLELRGQRTGSVFRLGDRKRVRVEKVDRVLQRVDLSLVAGGSERRTTRKAKRRAGPRRRRR